MADQDLTQKTSTGSVSGSDIIYVLVDPAGTPLDRKFTISNLSSHIRNDVVEADIPTGMSTDKIAGLSGTNTGDQAVGGLTDATITTVGDDDILAYDSGSGGWINQTAAEAGLAAASHTHAASEVDSGTFADARIAQSNVTQHEGAINIATSQITSGTLADARVAQSNVTQHEGAIDHDALTNFAANEHRIILIDLVANRPAAGTANRFFWATDEQKLYFDDGTAWDLVNAGTADALSTDAVDAITEIASALRTGSDTTIVTGTSGTSGNYLQWNGDGDAVDSGDNSSSFAAASHNHAASDVNSGTFADARIAESNVTQHEAAIDHENLTNITEHLMVSASDETTDLTTGTGKVTFRMPYALTLSAVRASVNTAPTGADLIVDINESGTSVLSTKLHIDAGEKTSETATTAAVISDSALADDAEITIDIDQIGSTNAGKGLKVTLIGTR